MFGELGILAQIDGKAQCHICGRLFGHLGGHIKRKHLIEASDYKREFGLNAQTGLIGNDLKIKRVAFALEHCQNIAEVGRAFFTNVSAEQRQQWNQDKETRQEAKLKPEFLTLRKEASRKGNAIRHRQALRRRVSKVCPTCENNFQVAWKDRAKIFCSQECYTRSEQLSEHGKKYKANLKYVPLNT